DSPCHCHRHARFAHARIRKARRRNSDRRTNRDPGAGDANELGKAERVVGDKSARLRGSGIGGREKRGGGLRGFGRRAPRYRRPGPEGRGTAKGSSIVDDSYLALVSDQNLRTTVIAGRPDLGHPDWRHDAPDRAMTSQEVTDVVAWLVAQRKPNPGQPYASNET